MPHTICGSILARLATKEGRKEGGKAVKGFVGAFLGTDGEHEAQSAASQSCSLSYGWVSNSPTVMILPWALSMLAD